MRTEHNRLVCQCRITSRNKANEIAELLHLAIIESGLPCLQIAAANRLQTDAPKFALNIASSSFDTLVSGGQDLRYAASEQPSVSQLFHVTRKVCC